VTLPANADLPLYPHPTNARLFDAEFERMAAQCMAYGEGIAPFDNSMDCTIASMGTNRATDLEVTTGGSGLNVSIAAGNAWVQGDGRATQGLYFCHVPIARTVTIATAHATLPRVDAMVLQISDADVSGSATQWEVVRVAGTATSGATLTNLTGAPAIPNSAFLLAYVLTPAAFAGPYVTATHIQDRRHFAYRPGRVIGYVTRTASTVGTPATLCTMQVVGNGNNRVHVEGFIPNLYSSAAPSTNQMSIQDAGVTVQFSAVRATVGNAETYHSAGVQVAPFQGTKTMTLVQSGSATLTSASAAASPSWIRATYV
jgi:hypothetical protein